MSFVEKFIKPTLNIFPPLLLVLILIVLSIAYVSVDILWPFFFSFIVAYLLNPMVVKLAKIGFNRDVSAFLITALFIFLVVILGIIITPFLRDEVISLVKNLPAYVEMLEDFLNDLLNKYFGSIQDFNVKGYLSQKIGDIMPLVFRFTTTVFNSGFALANIFALVIITPVVTFYLLRDWPLVINAISSSLNVGPASQLMEFIRQVDLSLRSFLRGQLIVCILLSIMYACALTIVGMKYATTLGIIIGLLCFIPFVGTLTGFMLTISLALVQFGWTIKISLVFLVFVIGQIVENSFLVPKFIGENIGVHPVWVIFALLSGAQIAGIWGMLFALPVTAIGVVMVRFAIKIR